jgi:hypothetical protein
VKVTGKRVERVQGEGYSGRGKKGTLVVGEMVRIVVGGKGICWVVEERV